MLMWTGDIRYLMAVLALVNYPHTIVERDQIDTKLRSMAWGQRVPRNEVRLLDMIPKPRGTTRYEKMFKGGGSPKRRHVRRGHWRRLKRRMEPSRSSGSKSNGSATQTWEQSFTTIT